MSVADNKQKERVLYFCYPFENKADMQKLKTVLEENKIEFICYESDGYYPHEFVVRKSGKKWEDIYKVINSVKAAKYNYKYVYLKYLDGQLKEYVY